MAKTLNSNSTPAYTSKDIDKLQQSIDRNFSDIGFTGDEGFYDSEAQTCHADDANNAGNSPKNEENDECNFSGVTGTTAKRNFDYVYNKFSGVYLDENGNSKSIFEVIAGDEKGKKISFEKTDLAGPCTERGHQGQSWDIEGYNSLPDNKAEIDVFALETNYKRLDHYLPYNISPKVYDIKAIKCGGGHSLRVKCYPDTELTMTANFTLFDGERSDKHEKETSKIKGKTSKLELELRRNGSQSFKINLFSSEKESTITNEAREAHDKFKALREFQEKWERFNTIKSKVFEKFEKSNKSSTPFSFQIVFLNMVAELKAKWIEVPGSRYCDYEVSGKIECNPIISLTFSWDFTNVVTNIPYIGQALALTDLFLETFELGDLAIKLEVKGSISISSERAVFRKLKIGDSSLKKNESLISLSGEIEIVLRAYAKANIHIDVWRFSCGGAAHAEAGFKAKFGDAETIYQGILNYVNDNWSERKKNDFNHKYGDAKKRESNLIYVNGKLIFHPKIGFSGLIIYTITYAQASCSFETHKVEPPKRFHASGDIGTTSQNKELGKSGISKEWGENKEKIQSVILPDPLLFEPKIVTI